MKFMMNFCVLKLFFINDVDALIKRQRDKEDGGRSCLVRLKEQSAADDTKLIYENRNLKLRDHLLSSRDHIF